jgi:hypothetical protein
LIKTFSRPSNWKATKIEKKKSKKSMKKKLKNKKFFKKNNEDLFLKHEPL